MKALKGCAVVAAIGIIAVATLAIGFGNSSGVGLWLVQGMIDRVNPLAIRITVYAQVPAPDAYFDSYEDATGGGENYVYEVHAYDEHGAEHTANLVSFGGKLGDGADASAETCLKLIIKGSFVQRWERIAAGSVPVPAARVVG